MRNLQLLTFVLFFFGGGTAIAEGRPESVVLRSDAPVFSFGTRDTTETVTNTFTVTNTSDRPMSISDVKVSCGCTTPVISRRTIPAGESAEVTISLNLWSLRGWIRKSAVIIAGDRPVLTLWMQGTVTRQLEVLPEKLEFGQVEAGQIEDRTLVVLAATGSPVRVVRADPIDPYAQTTVETLADGKAYLIRVRLTPPSTATEIHTGIRIISDYPKNPVIDVPLTARMVTDLEVLPVRLLIAGVGDDKSARHIVLRRQKVENFEARFAENLPNANVAVRETDDGYRVTVTPTVAWSELHGREILLHTDVDSMKEIRIPITVGDLER